MNATPDWRYAVARSLVGPAMLCCPFHHSRREYWSTCGNQSSVDFCPGRSDVHCKILKDTFAEIGRDRAGLFPPLPASPTSIIAKVEALHQSGSARIAVVAIVRHDPVDSD